MLYAITSEFTDNNPDKRLAARPEHLARLEKLTAKGRLIVAGPHPLVESDNAPQAGFSGSLIIAEFTSLKKAKAWAADDPYIHAGLYAKFKVKPFIKVLP